MDYNLVVESANSGEVLGDASKAVLGLTLDSSEGTKDGLPLGADDGTNTGEVLGDADRAVLGLTYGASEVV